MSEQMLDAVSTINEHGQPHLGECTLVVGDGTMKVDFKHGRAVVPARLAHLVAKHPHVTVYGLDTVNEPQAVPSPAETPAVAATESSSAPAKDSDAEERRRAAIEYLREEGIEFSDSEQMPADPAVVKTAPAVTNPNFDAVTADGQPRCQAAKTDGSQCANPAVEDSDRCNLPSHRRA